MIPRLIALTKKYSKGDGGRFMLDFATFYKVLYEIINEREQSISLELLEHIVKIDPKNSIILLDNNFERILKNLKEDFQKIRL